jgi:hypothetical protein
VGHDGLASQIDDGIKGVLGRPFGQTPQGGNIWSASRFDTFRMASEDGELMALST